MTFIAFLALGIAGIAIMYAEEAKKQTNLLMKRVENLEQQNQPDEKQ